MTDEPTRPLPDPAGHPVDLPGRQPIDMYRQRPVDPWAGSAPVVPPPPYGTTEPYVIVVERPRRRRWPWLLGGLAGLGQAVIICACADHGSIGAGIFYGGWTMDDAAEKLRDLRAAVVRRG